MTQNNSDPAFGADSNSEQDQKLAAQHAPARPLSPAARRALAEAVARRAEIDRRTAEMPPEEGGRKGAEPVRYGDWEVKGLASDF